MDFVMKTQLGSSKKTGSFWEAFENKVKNLFPERGLFPVEISSANSIPLSDGLMLAIAIELGFLVGRDGALTIGLNIDSSRKTIRVDDVLREASLTSLDLAKTLFCDIKNAPEDLTSEADIEIVLDNSTYCSNNSVWLVLDGDSLCVSLLKGRITGKNIDRVVKLVSFATQRLFDPVTKVPNDLLPLHFPIESDTHIMFIKRVYEHVQLNPNAVAISDDSSSKVLTYRELWDLSSGLMQTIIGGVLTQYGHPRIALLMERSWQYLVSVIAVQRLGGTCVLLEPSNPDLRIHGLLEDSKPDAVIVAGNTVSRTELCKDFVVFNLDNIEFLDDCCEVAWSNSNNKDCFIAGTSGSTGKPKLVCLSYKGMMTTISAIVDEADLGEKTRGTWLSSPGYGMVEVDPLPVLASGGSVHIPRAEVLSDLGELTTWFAQNGIRHTLLMTSIAEALWESHHIINLHTMLIAGERCKRWPPTDVSYRVLNVYGSAEAAVVAIGQLTSNQITSLPSVGRTVRGANAYVVDSQGNELPAGCVGDLIITGQTLSEGYLSDVETKKVFKPNKMDSSSKCQYYTGDRARILPCGTIEIFGRNDRTVKIRGHRIDLTEIEVTALNVLGVHKAAVVCSSDDLSTSLVLFIESSEYEQCVEAVYTHLEEVLPAAALPNKIIPHKLPLNANDKVDYNELSKIALETLNISHVKNSSFKPKNKLESYILNCWCKWTSTEYVDPSSSFFDIGGDSLKAMRMLGELSCDKECHIEMKLFLEDPSLSSLIKLANEVSRSSLPKLEHLPNERQAEAFDLNESQQALWIGRGGDFDFGGVGCQGYFEWEVENLSYPDFSKAIELLIARHPMLRMTIDKFGQQVIQPFTEINPNDAIAFNDLTVLPFGARQSEITKLRDKFANEEIGTQTWPLFNFLVSKVDDCVYRVHFNVDMLIADAWSIFQVIIPDLIDYYHDGGEHLPEINTTFRDYVAYRKEVIKSARYERDRLYWLDKIQYLPPAPKLPTNEFKQGTQEFYFERHHGCLNREKWAALQSIAQKSNISPTGAVALALCEVIRQWNEEQHFTLNFPVSDRMPVTEDIDNIVGDFTNTLLVPYQTEPNDSLLQRGQKLQSSIWDALDHRLFSGVEVLRELSRIKRAGSTPLMPIVLTSLLGHPGRHDAAKLGPEVYGVSQTPQVTLDVQLRESEDVLYFKWDYLKGVIKQDVINDMFDAFCSLLEKMSSSNDIWDRTSIDMRSVEQKKVRDLVNSTNAPLETTNLKELLDIQVNSRGENIALVSPNESYTWSDIGKAAQNLGSRLLDTVATSEKMVGVILPKGVAQYISVYSAIYAGLGYVPIDPDLPIERIKHILSASNVGTVVSDKAQNLPEDIQCLLLDLSEPALWSEPVYEIQDSRNLRGYCPYIIFTSGSTGDPKGVEIPERAVINHIYDVVERFKLDHTTRHLATAALHFDMSVFDVFGPLVHGGSVVVPDATVGPDPDQWLKLQRKHKVNFWACVPAIMDLMTSVNSIADLGAAISSLKNIVMAGDWIPLSLLPRARALYPNAILYSCGGPTETTNWSIIHEISLDEGDIVNSVLYGVPMRNSKYHIISKGGQHCPDWVPGEMWVESDVSLANGYIGRPDLTEQAFVTQQATGKRFYKTGDLGRYLPNGEIEILGRVDNQIKINGLRVELGEIENVALKVPNVDKAHAFALLNSDQRPKNIALAYVGTHDEEKSITENLITHLPKYMVPSVIKRLETIPLSKNGKVDIKALRTLIDQDKETTMSDKNKNYLRIVIGSISEQLGAQVVLPDDNFLDLGGDSISAMKVKIQLEAQLSKEVALESILMSESIADIAEQLEVVEA
ncbi:non-ribosomal peptide synthetase [Vibrio coralliilyticus]|uniref:non-ribosomal peptide synthetase n=2 Tax=Vibrio coralliilyticus TaxID=190893 RepID=UPI001E5964AA|nr:non-ribosomal peptide synthetase [Vibrio coralliilyticus]MCC2524250.1 amino acid adenylation domain-containing protein [Vibrio coralliilyticus]